MKAPDKCYITREKNGVIYSISFNDNGGLKYIREDALMEWLEKKVSISYGAATNALVEVIDKLNSL